MTSDVVLIREVRTGADAAHVKRLALLFVDWLRGRYPDLQSEIDGYLAGQDFTSDLDELLTVFNPPDGECLLALLDNRPVGILMLKRWDATSCEMNRMFVADSARGRGIGRNLCMRLIDRATQLGYETMMLTALDKHDEALALYRSLNFRETPGWSTEERDRQLCMTLDLG
jgi:GNAT superfamily N-acetyltransferase